MLVQWGVVEMIYINDCHKRSTNSKGCSGVSEHGEPANLVGTAQLGELVIKNLDAEKIRHF